MKKTLYILALFVGLFVLSTNAKALTVETGIREAIAEEIAYFGDESNFDDEQTFNAYQTYVSKLKSANLVDYTEDDSKVNIYIFRGSTCWHCLDEITWLSTKVNEYGKYFNIRTYEVWENKDNSKLLKSVAKVLGETTDGVPFTVVGKRTFSGFSDTTGEEILKEVKTQYENKDRYDIKNDVNLEDGTVKNNNSKSSNTVMIVLISIVVIAGIGVIVYICKSK